MNKYKFKKLLTVTAVSILSIPSISQAAVFHDCFGNNKAKWESPVVTMKVDESFTDFGYPFDEIPLRRSELQIAANAISTISGSKFRLRLEPDNSTQGYDNGESEIYINDVVDGKFGQTQEFANGRDTLAVAHYIYETSFLGAVSLFNETGSCIFGDATIVEADIIINSDNLDPLSGIDIYEQTRLQLSTNPFLFSRVMLHEFGHVAGLLHENGTMATMMGLRPFAGDVGPSQITFMGDDRKGMRSLYWDSDRQRDLAISRYRCCGDGGVFAPGDKNALITQMKNDSGRDISTARRGQAVRIPWLVHNLGSQQEDVQVKIFLTKNINSSVVESSTNILLGTDYTGYLEPKGWVEGSKRVIIPRNIARGNYYLKWVVDFNNNIPTSNFLERDNNWTYRRIPITIN